LQATVLGCTPMGELRLLTPHGEYTFANGELKWED
jgi:hypothetical protein